MASNLRVQVEPPVYREIPPSRSDQHSSWSMRLKPGQIIVLLAIMSGVIVMVFLFAFYAGREQGLKLALANAGSGAVRLPIGGEMAAVDLNAADIADVETKPSSEAPEIDQMLSSLVGRNDSTSFGASSSAETAEAKKPEPPRLDFSQNRRDAQPEKLEPAKTIGARAATAGFAAKSTSEVLSADKPAAIEPPTRVLSAQVEMKPPSAVIASVEKPKPVKPAVPAKVAVPEPIVASVKQSKPAAKPAPAPKAISAGWYVQVAAARDSAEANGMKKQLNAAGNKTVIQEAVVKNTTYYRVLVGPFPSQELAQEGRNAVKRSGVARGEPFLKRVR